MSLPDFILPIATDDPDRKLLSDISQYGWHIIVIQKEVSSPTYSFTVGLFYTFGHPELMIMGLNQNVSHSIFQTAAGAIASGATFQASGFTDILIDSYKCKFSEIGVSRYQEYLGYGIWFYRSLPRPFPALQILWPDKSGKYPGEDGFDVRFNSLQVKI
jgi:hypothetical protein